MSAQDTQALAGEYVLGLLDADERRRVEALLTSDPALGQAVAQWREELLELDAAGEPLPPTPQLWARIESAIAARTAAPVKPRRPLLDSLWSSLGFWRGAGLAGTFASLLLAVGLAFVAGRPAPQPIVVAIMEGAQTPTNVFVEAYGDGSIRVVPLGVIEVPAGKTLQVWTLWDRARGPVSMGLMGERLRTMHFGASGLPEPAPDQLYEISLEPEGGSPTGRPTGPILFKGAALRPS